MVKKGESKKKVPADTYSVLTAASYIPSQPLKTRKILTTTEQGRKYVLQMSGNENSVLYDVDGYIATSFPANKSNPLMEKAKIEFAKSPYFCELRGLKNGQKDMI